MNSALIKMLFASSLILASGLIASTVAYAHEGEEHGHKHGTETEAKNAISVPNTAVEIWNEIDAKVAELDKTIQSGELKNVHHEAFAIRDLVAALPAKSSDLPAENLGKVKASVKYVATLAERLDKSGDADDKSGVKTEYDKLIQVLKGLRANYASNK